MMPTLVWGAPDLPEHTATTRGWTVRSKKRGILFLLVSLAGVLAITGLMAPGALGSEYESGLVVTFQAQPRDAESGQTITSSPFDTGADPVAVEVLDAYEVPVTGAFVELTFAPGSEEGGISGNVAETEDGVATFPELSITGSNEPLTTDYQLLATATVPDIELSVASTSSSGGTATSDTFDIWDQGCHGNGCEVALRSGRDTYKTSENVGMGASIVLSTAIDIECPGQQLIFSSDVFFHATSGNGPVFLTSRITRQEMKAASNNGQAHVEWCVGLKDPDAWEHNGASFTTQNVNGVDLFVGSAPKCPKKSAASFAPCIVKQRGDGNGGNITTGWLPGGDPPRRT